MWDNDLFDQPVMIEWNGRPIIQKDYASIVTYFTKHLVAIESFEAASGGAPKKQEYTSTNAATKLQTVCVAEIKATKVTANEDTRDTMTASVGEIAEQQAAIK